jgi:hypothetical protein
MRMNSGFENFPHFQRIFLLGEVNGKDEMGWLHSGGKSAASSRDELLGLDDVSWMGRGIEAVGTIRVMGRDGRQ